VLPQIERARALDPLTVVITWKTTFFKWRELAYTDLWPFPRHVLGAAFERDKDAFLNLPYWTTDYVQLGAFRLVDFGLGENLVLDRFDDYFLGRPKVDRILIKIIGDRSAVYANLLAGAVDIVTESVIEVEIGAELRQEWRRTGAGIVVDRPSNWQFINIQHNPDYGQPPEVRQDVRVRRGLLMGLDRLALREIQVPGFEPEMDSFLLPSDPRARIVGKPFARYRYDPALAARELAETGWRRGADGRALNRAGEPVQLPLRGGNDRIRAVVAQQWRDLGIEVIEEVMPGSLMADRPYRATFPGMELTAHGSGDRMLIRFDGRLCPRPPRFSGSQGGCYINADLDRLIDRLYMTLDLRDQGLVLKEIGDLFAADLPALPMYYDVTMGAVRKGIRALIDDFAGSVGPGTTSRHAHLWDRE
jgi:peptide/nickel transport system substrate-binding protein